MISANKVRMIRQKLLFNAHQAISPGDVLELCESWLAMHKKVNDEEVSD